MISGSDLKNGMTIIYHGEPCRVEYFQHVKPGKGSAFTRTKLKSLATGSVLEYTFKAREDIQTAQIERRDMEFLYRDNSDMYFMDPESYEQIPFPISRCKDIAPFMKEGSTATVVIFEEKVLDITIPNSVELVVAKTDPGLKGDTASGGSKPAELETGGVVNVPLFINEGEIIQVDTRTGEYMGRA